MDFFAVKIVTGSDVIVRTGGQGAEYTSIWHVFRSKNSLRILSRKTFSVANIVSFQKRAYYEITSCYFVDFDSEKVHEDEIFERQDVLHFFSEESKDYEYVKSPNMR